MTERVLRLLEKQKSIKQFPICTERIKITIPVYEKYDGLPLILKRAHAVSEYLDKRTIFIEDDELIIGNIASKPMGLEADDQSPTWKPEDLDALIEGGRVSLDPEDRKYLEYGDKYWRGRYRTRYALMGRHYDDDRLWPFIKRGFLCPPWTDKVEGRGNGAAGCAWGMTMGPTVLFCPDYGKIIAEGYEKTLNEVKEAQKQIRYNSDEDLEKADLFESAVMIIEAMIRMVERYSILAAEMAEKESDPGRRAELQQISEICKRVPRKGATTFREAIQAFFFYWMYTTGGATPGGRFDQYMYPYYKADLEAGRITREEALELIECLRVKIMSFNTVFGGKKQQEKWAGMARWHNFVIGGCDLDGNDATNDISYMMLEAAKETRTTTPTLTVRVNKDNPPEFMRAAADLVKTGMGMPAFISEDSYINFVQGYGVSLEEAREFAIAGCLEIQIPGRSRNMAFGMFIVPMVLELALYDGCEPKSGERFGPPTGNFEEFESYEDFYQAFLTHLAVCIGMVNEEHNIQVSVHGREFPEAFNSIFMEGSIETGKDGQRRPLTYENSSCCNMVGNTTVVDSLAVIKKLVFEDKTVTAQEMINALRANWEGYEELQAICKDVPKYGNDDDFVDSIGVRFWEDYARIVGQHTNTFGLPLIPTATSITAHAPGGAMTSATPDGRCDGETLADGSTSPFQGYDKNGPMAVLRSAMKLNQDDFQATLMNMKFHTSAFNSDSDLDKIGALIKTYLNNGGKHIQFNVADKETLIAAKKDKEKYSDLIVRVAGYSSYFTVLTEKVQDEVIQRTAHGL